MINKTQSVSAGWFRASEATGDFMGIRYGRISHASQELEWHFVSHCVCDGIGGFARLLRERGAQLPSLPQTKHRDRSLIRPLWKLWRKKPTTLKVAARADWAPRQNQLSGISKAVACHLFSEKETELVRQRCRETGVTVNSYLLKHLDMAIRPETKQPEALIPWMIPVNLRGDVRLIDDTENHVSCVEPKIGPEDTVNDIQGKIREGLERGEHRANYLVLCFGKFLSHKKKVQLISKMRAQPNGNIGAFSNLGVWDSEKAIKTKDSWFFCPPVCGGQLLSAGCVTFQNRLSLTIQGHAQLSDQPEIAQRWMQHWLEGVNS